MLSILNFNTYYAISLSLFIHMIWGGPNEVYQTYPSKRGPPSDAIQKFNKHNKDVTGTPARPREMSPPSQALGGNLITNNPIREWWT